MLLSAVLSAVPEGFHRLIPQVIIFVPRRKIQQQEGNPPLLLEIFHKRDLVLVDVCERKGIRFALFGIEADGNALYSADVINGTLLFKISQRDVSALLIYFDRGDRRRHLLISARCLSRYCSFVRLIISSNVDPRSPLDVHAIIPVLVFVLFLFNQRNFVQRPVAQKGLADDLVFLYVRIQPVAGIL